MLLVLTQKEQMSFNIHWLMLKIVLFIALLLPITAHASAPPQKFGYRACNHHEFNFFLLKVYDVYLCVDNKAYLYPGTIFNQDFSLIINYNMNFDKSELSQSSIEEMNRYYDLNIQDQKAYYNQLMSIFPNVKKGDKIEAKYSKEGKVSFYHNRSLTGNINEPKFAQRFLDIWLYKDNKYKKMTKDLFKKYE